MYVKKSNNQQKKKFMNRFEMEIFHRVRTDGVRSEKEARKKIKINF